MEKEISKRQNSVGYIIAIVLLILIVLGMGCYIMYDKEIIFANDVEEKETNKNDDSEEKNNDVSLTFDSSKIINKSDDMNYSVLLNNMSFDGVNGSISEDKKSVELTIYWNLVSNMTGVSHNNGNPQTIKISNFSGKVSDLYIGGTGQEVGGTVLLFLMEDGTVEYMPLYNALVNNDIKSYGKLEGVDGVVKFYYGSVAYSTEGVASGHRTVFAQRADGTIYDLIKMIKF